MIERNEELVTVFGGGGFIGRYVCEILLKRGVRVRVAQRNPRQAYAIQPLGQVGYYGMEAADVTKPASVRNAPSHPGAESPCRLSPEKASRRLWAAAQGAWAPADQGVTPSP